MISSRWRFSLPLLVAVGLGTLLLLSLSFATHSSRAALRGGVAQAKELAPSLRGVTELISVDANETQGSGDSSGGSSSKTGRWVAFATLSSLVPSDTNGTKDIYRRDVYLSDTLLVTFDEMGGTTNGLSYEPSISGDGSAIAFSSFAAALVPGDTNGPCVQDALATARARMPTCSGVFVYDFERGINLRASQSNLSVEADGASHSPRLSADGRVVVYESIASNLIPGPIDTNNKVDIFAHFLGTRQTRRVSIPSGGGLANGDSRWPTISANGRYVVFYSDATNLVAGDLNGAWDVFIFDLVTARIERVSMAHDGAQGNGNSGGPPPFVTAPPAVSADGRWVAFQSDATNLVSGDSNNQSDIFLRDRVEGETTLVSVGDDGEPLLGSSAQPSISSDGRWIAYRTGYDPVLARGQVTPNIVLFDREEEETYLISQDAAGEAADAESNLPSLALDGGSVVFESLDTLTMDDMWGGRDIFQRDIHGVVTGQFTTTPPQQMYGFIHAVREQANGSETREAPIERDGHFSLVLPPGTWNLSYRFFGLGQWYGPRLDGIEVEPEGAVDLGLIAVDEGQSLNALIRKPDATLAFSALLGVASRLSNGETMVRTFAFDPKGGTWHYSVPDHACGRHVVFSLRDIPGLIAPRPAFFDTCQGPPFATLNLFYREPTATLSGTVSVSDTLGTRLGVPVFISAYSPQGGSVQTTAFPSGTYEIYLPEGAWQITARYDNGPEERYASPVYDLFVGADDTELKQDLALVPDPLLTPLGTPQQFPVPVAQDTVIQMPLGPTTDTIAMELFIPAGTFSGASITDVYTVTIFPLGAALPHTDLSRPHDYGFEIKAINPAGEIEEGPFAREMRISFPIEADPSVSDTLRVLYYEPQAQNYLPLNEFTVDEEHNQLHAFTDHFSIWIGSTMAVMDDDITGLAVEHPNPVRPGVEVPFEASVTTGPDVVYVWDFGDGTPEQVGASVAHTFTQTGQYTVTLTASNATSSVTSVFTVDVLYTIWLPYLLP